MEQRNWYGWYEDIHRARLIHTLLGNEERCRYAECGGPIAYIEINTTSVGDAHEIAGAALKSGEILMKA